MWSGLKGALGLAFFGTPLGWRLTPGLAWRLYLSEFYAPIAAASPHAGFAALARLESEKVCTVVTMNVDELHEVHLCCTCCFMVVRESAGLFDPFWVEITVGW